MNLELIFTLAAAGAALAGVGLIIRARARAREARDRKRLATAHEEGLHLPPSLHPVIDPDRCIGSLACVSACPEGDVLGIVDGMAALVVGANCVGHGRCALECPAGAIRLVFGTSERGIDIPRVTPEFESTVPGIYIAGELGGMGLIRNAVRQGTAAVRHLAAQLPPARQRTGEADDVLIAGAGPAGLAAALAAMESGLRARVIEQEAFGGTIAHFPRQKVVVSEAFELPLAGRIDRGTLSKEELLARFFEARQRFALPIQEGERVEDIRRVNGTFQVITNQHTYAAHKVVLAVGRRGTPRRLGVPGEELPTVTYRLIDPEQYAGRRVLVVGGGDSAAEAACALAEARAEVTLCHRGPALGRCKPANRDRVARLAAENRIHLLPRSVPVRFEPSLAFVSPADPSPAEARSDDAPGKIEADHVIICAGGELPADLLSRVGVQVDRRYGDWS